MLKAIRQSWHALKRRNGNSTRRNHPEGQDKKENPHWFRRFFAAARIWRAFFWLHALCGPVIGTAVLLLYYHDAGITPFVPGNDIMSRVASYLATVIVGSLPGYLLGLVPAATHALAMLLLSTVLRSRLVWYAMTPVIGYTSSAAFTWYVYRERPSGFDIVEHQGLLGAIVAIICMSICWKLGILPKMRTRRTYEE